MQNVPSQSVKVKALKAIDTFLTNENRLTGFSLKDHLLFVLGGPEHCLNCCHDTRDAVKGLLKLVDQHKAEMGYSRNVAVHLLDNLLMTLDSLIEDPYVEAELAKWVVETDDTDTICPHLSEEYLNNLIRQYELLLHMEALKKEQRDIMSRDYEQKNKVA